jgi:iron complex transport system substrate-binding protein
MSDLNRISGIIVDVGFQISVKLGPGLLENIYERILARDLTRRGLQVERQKRISFDYEGMWFADAFRVDLLVEQAIVVEVKSVPALGPAQHKQLLTYLRIMDCRLGLLLNFGTPLFKDGIVRIANKL